MALSSDRKVQGAKIALPSTEGVAKAVEGTTEGTIHGKVGQLSLPPSSTTRRKLDLPVELWMRVFEQVRIEDDTYVRTAYARDYENAFTPAQSSGGSNDASSNGTADNDTTDNNHGKEMEAVKTLPTFELRAWKKTRAFYAINRNSRAAALKLNLFLQMLKSCSVPLASRERKSLVQVLWPAYKSASSKLFVIEIYFDWLEDDPSIGLNYAHQRLGANGGPNQPIPPNPASLLFDSGGYVLRPDFYDRLGESAHENVQCPPSDPSVDISLAPAEHIVLLIKARPGNFCEEARWSVLTRIGILVEAFRQINGVSAAKLEILH